MADEKMRILEMIQNGKLTPAEGLELLKALEDTEIKPREVQGSEPPHSEGRVLRIRVINDQSKVNVNIPLSLLKVATKFAGLGMKFIPEDARQEMAKKGIDLSEINFDELVQLIDQGLVDGKLVDIDTDEPNAGRTTVAVYVE